MKNFLFVTSIIIFLLIINDLAHSIYDIWQKKDFVSEAQIELDFQKQENQRLKSALSYSQTPEFIEKEARNKLFMVKEGEQKVLLSKEEKERQNPPAGRENIPNWKQWMELFF
jgi:cell division protein FtsB